MTTGEEDSSVPLPASQAIATAEVALASASSAIPRSNDNDFVVEAVACVENPPRPDAIMTLITSEKDLDALQCLLYSIMVGLCQWLNLRRMVLDLLLSHFQSFFLFSVFSFV